MLTGSALAIPPFPGAKPPRFAEPIAGSERGPDWRELLAALAQNRVGGCYWGKQRPLPGSYVLNGTNDRIDGGLTWDPGDDPWHLLSKAEFARLSDDDPRALLVLAAGLPLVLVSSDGTVRSGGDDDASRWAKALLWNWRFTSPFSGSELGTVEAIELCGFWRGLIDANRRIFSVMGVAYWKKPTASPLLWGGQAIPYNHSIAQMPQGSAVAIWRSRLTAAQARHIEKTQAQVIEIEDGFIRSKGLGADCVPPLSIIVDELGPHFAPGAPSALENMLELGSFSQEILGRARSLREAIIAAGLSKYESSEGEAVPRYGGLRRHVLVPGQVEDDRAVTSGGALSSNLELLRRARAVAGPDAYVIYKPHPDVLAGHRRGQIAESDMRALADRIETSAPMAALISMADELHVNSSLAGFEALLRGKPVTVHGVPFYAGWGLTNDLGPVPARRTARRTLDELVAAAYLLYPRYLDPETNLPCPAEVLVYRLARANPSIELAASLLVAGRRILGRTRKILNL
jgi:capsular polysaccharide export protein